MKLRRIIKDRKGVSSLFISLYLAILAIIFISTLFIAINTYGSSLVDHMQVEQERMQEALIMAGPEALNLSESLVVQSLRVNNTGSITIRIRALYIDQTFICDPSEFAGDAYIEPKEALWIQLSPNVDPPIVLNGTTTIATWTVTTERGTRASEQGGNLKWGGPGTPYTPNKFYFGPLMLIFDMFHWQSESGPWENGWTIPKGTKDVTWQILLVNVDNRDIIIEETSCFTLISNDNSPKDPKPWYIDPNLSSTVLTPGVYNFIYYSWSKPFSAGGSSRQGLEGLKETTTCINFLTFYGYFREIDGSLTAFGQTIPFESVLIT
jgi:hypothetical protein